MKLLRRIDLDAFGLGFRNVCVDIVGIDFVWKHERPRERSPLVLPGHRKNVILIRNVDLLGLEAGNGNLDDVTIRRPANIEAAVPGRSVER